MKYLCEFENYSYSSLGLSALEFEGGMADVEFFTGGRHHNGNLNLISSGDIYYDNNLLVKKGETIPYFHKVQTWADVNTSNASVIIDLRPSGVYGTNFDKNKLNDGNGASGHNFRVEFVLSY